MLSLSVNSSLFRRINIGGFLSPTLHSPDPKKLKISAGLQSLNSAAGVLTQSVGTGRKGVTESLTKSPDDAFVQAGLRRELTPKHVAAILDGNRRWAKAHGKDLDYSHFCQGYMALAHLCIKWGVSTLTCFMFSTENGKRSKEANDLLFEQFQGYLQQSLDTFTRMEIKTTIIGDKTRLPKSLQEVINQVEDETKSNSKLELNFAVNYGGKCDVVQAIRSISKKAKAGEIDHQEIDEALMDQLLSTRSFRVPDPDLMICTGRDLRLSNFLMWQMSHTEFYFTDVYGPDFGEPHFIDALRWFQQCDRLFGK